VSGARRQGCQSLSFRKKTLQERRRDERATVER
jgi:hypothetical protein